MIQQFEIPFVLRNRTRLTDNGAPGSGQRYDPKLQLWVSVVSGNPLVSEHITRRQERLRASEFGETIVTKTCEGHDQTEGVQASEFGETVITRTAEGADQREALASDFGETVVTETREGIDHREVIV